MTGYDHERERKRERKQFFKIDMQIPENRME